MLENCDKIMHLRFNFDACAPDASKSHRACIILLQCTRKSKYAVINYRLITAYFTFASELRQNNARALRF